MIKKTLTASLFSSLLTVVTFSASAGLNISNLSSIDKVQVKCGTVPGVPIAKGQSIRLEWRTIKIILGNHNQGSCEFFRGNVHLGVASIEINPTLTAAKITTFQLDASAPIKVALDTAVGEENREINAVVSDLG